MRLRRRRGRAWRMGFGTPASAGTARLGARRREPDRPGWRTPPERQHSVRPGGGPRGSAKPGLTTPRRAQRVSRAVEGSTTDAPWSRGVARRGYADVRRPDRHLRLGLLRPGPQLRQRPRPVRGRRGLDESPTTSPRPTISSASGSTPTPTTTAAGFTSSGPTTT